MRQGTIVEEIFFEGIGIHSGLSSKVVLHPERENTGIRFLKDGVIVPARIEFVINTDHSTDLGKKGVLIKTVEHLMAVLYMLGVDNLTVELIEGFELPILDGSGYGFYKLLKDRVLLLNEERQNIELKERIQVKNCSAYIQAVPYDTFSASYTGSVKGFFENRTVKFKGNIKDVVHARTFCYDYEVEHLFKRGLARGGSLKNAVVLGNGFVYNKGGLRSHDEPLRHKLLDLIGDIALLGKIIKGHVMSYMGGHGLNYEFLKHLSQTMGSFSKTVLISSSVSTP
ncbi:MAG: UDP-3-O-acyl-N-acetylglucosamine deacetylase [Aquificaceae bacterium]